MSNVVNLAERRFQKRSPGNNTYCTVRKKGAHWTVVFVTPVSGLKELKTVLATFAARDHALDHAAKVSRQSGVPFKMKGVKQ